MPPTTSDRFFALAARVESALAGVGIPADLTNALRSYWEQPTAHRLAVLVEAANRLLFVPINEGTLDRLHPAILAYRALDDAIGVFYDNDHPDAHAAATAHLDQCERLLARDPLLPVRLVDGVWTTDGAVEIAGQTLPATVTWGEPGVRVRNMRCIPEPNLSEIVIPVTMDADEARRVAEHVLAHGQRTIFAAVALDGSGVWAVGDTEADARKSARNHRGFHRGLGCDMPPLETDAAWSAALAIVTLSGAAESLRAIVASVDDVIPWCPADLWDSGEVTP